MKLLQFFFIKSNKQHRINGEGFLNNQKTKRSKWANSKPHYILNSQFLPTIVFPGRTVFKVLVFPWYFLHTFNFVYKL